MKTKTENKIIFFGLCLLFLMLPLVIFFENETNLFNIEPAIVPHTEASVQENGGSDNKSYQSQEVKSGEPETVDSKKSFSIIVLPDTQKYAKYYPEILCNQTEWIVKNKQKLNAALVIELGDVVDSGASSPNEWDVARNCFDKLTGVIPWSVVPGNHDTDVLNDKTSGFDMYDAYFPASLFNTYSWYKEGFRNNQNSFLVVEKLGMKVGLLNLSIEPDDEILKWAEAKIKENTDMYFIVATHDYLVDDKTGRDKYLQFGPDGNTGEDIWHKLIKKNCDVKLVLNGHYHMTDGEHTLVSKNNCNEDVMQTIQDYQARENGGNGLLRIYTFTPGEKTVKVQTHSSYTKTFETDRDSHFEFLIP